MAAATRGRNPQSAAAIRNPRRRSAIRGNPQSAIRNPQSGDCPALLLHFLYQSSMQELPVVDRVGAATLSMLEFVGALASFGGRAIVEAFRPPYEGREILRHLYQFGTRSAPLVATAGLAIGVVLSMHTRASLERFGAQAMIPAGLAIALIRETGPLTAGLLVSGRVGAGIGAEIGAMKVTEQIDALEANAVDSFKYLAVTRIIALMIAMPLLTLVMDFAGIFGGYIAEVVVSGMSWSLYFER